MYKFVKIKDDNNEYDKTNVSVTIPFNDITLDDLCEAFTDFIKACGFYIDKRIAAIIPDPEYSDEKKEEEAPPITDKDIFVPDSEIIAEQSQPPEEIN